METNTTYVKRTQKDYTLRFKQPNKPRQIQADFRKRKQIKMKSILK